MIINTWLSLVVVVVIVIWWCYGRGGVAVTWQPNGCKCGLSGGGVDCGDSVRCGVG
jgi:hypothetical protein